MAYDCNTDAKNIHKARVVTSLEEMPYACWCMTGAKGVGHFMFFRKISADKACFFQVDGEERMWDAAEVFETVKGVRLFFPTKIVLQGDDRPIFDTEEEEEAFFAAKDGDLEPTTGG
jgi:hypothetical protein